MTGSTTTTDTFAAGWFEACVTHDGADVDAPCATCGWLAADHTAGLAPVIAVVPVTAPVPLRRAS